MPKKDKRALQGEPEGQLTRMRDENIVQDENGRAFLLKETGMGTTSIRIPSCPDCPPCIRAGRCVLGVENE